MNIYFKYLLFTGIYRYIKNVLPWQHAHLSIRTHGGSLTLSNLQLQDQKKFSLSTII